MMNIYNRAIKPKLRRLAAAIQLLVIKSRIDEGFGVAPLGDLGDQVLNECACHAGVPVREVMDIGMLLVVDRDRGEAQCAAFLSFANGEQFCPSIGPIDSLVSRHAQYVGITYAKRVLQVVEVVVAVEIVLQFFRRYVQQVHAAFQDPQQLRLAFRT